jgi:hypothetical protein
MEIMNEGLHKGPQIKLPAQKRSSQVFISLSLTLPGSIPMPSVPFIEVNNLWDIVKHPSQHSCALIPLQNLLQHTGQSRMTAPGREGEFATDHHPCGGRRPNPEVQ